MQYLSSSHFVTTAEHLTQRACLPLQEQSGSLICLSLFAFYFQILMDLLMAIHRFGTWEACHSFVREGKINEDKVNSNAESA